MHGFPKDDCYCTTGRANGQGPGLTEAGRQPPHSMKGDTHRASADADAHTPSRLPRLTGSDAGLLGRFERLTVCRCHSAEQMQQCGYSRPRRTRPKGPLRWYQISQMRLRRARVAVGVETSSCPVTRLGVLSNQRCPSSVKRSDPSTRIICSPPPSLNRRMTAARQGTRASPRRRRNL